MAFLHTDLPLKDGERKLVRRIQAIDDPMLHIWCGLDHIPGVADIDLLLIHEQAGIFVIEIKAIPLKMIHSFSLNRCEIEGRTDTRTPHLQASDARWKLKELFDRHFKQRAPRIEATACFPLITRREWDDSFGKPSPITGEFSESIIFSCDLSGDSEDLKKRLQHIWFNPPMLSGAKYPFAFNKSIIDQITGIVCPIPQKPMAAPSDYERLQAIENVVRTRAVHDCPTDKQTRILYTGRPGTGKTFRLVSIGMSHALAGKRVLFVCFNKTLATDIARLILLSEKLRKKLLDEEAVFDVFDISLLAKRYKKGSEDNYTQWLESALENASKSDGLPIYDLVLVDEAQDMNELYLRLANLHCSPGTSLCVAAGTGQELYGSASEWLEDFQTDPRTREIRLNRNFRNTRPTFQIAQVFYDSDLDLKRAEKLILRYKQPQVKQLEIEFDRPHGEWPIVPNIDDSQLNWDDAGSWPFQEELKGIMITRYVEIISDQLDQLTAKERPMDILVLVPAYKSPERDWAYSALEQLTDQYDIDFLDYTEEGNRRQPAHPDSIRLCTYASARGLEGYRTVIFGFEGLERLCKATNQAHTNLGYIVLSRAVFETVLVRRLKHTMLPPVEHVVMCMRLLKESAAT